MLNEESYIVDGSQYTMIKYIKDPRKEEINLFGVVVGFSEKELNDKSGWCCTLNLFDETCEDGFVKVTLIDKLKENLPRVSVYDVIRLQKVKFNEMNGLFLENSADCWLLWKECSNNIPWPISSKNLSNHSTQDKQRMLSLYEWSKKLKTMNICRDNSTLNSSSDGSVLIAEKTELIFSTLKEILNGENGSNVNVLAIILNQESVMKVEHENNYFVLNLTDHTYFKNNKFLSKLYSSEDCKIEFQDLQIVCLCNMKITSDENFQIISTDSSYWKVLDGKDISASEVSCAISANHMALLIEKRNEMMADILLSLEDNLLCLKYISTNQLFSLDCQVLKISPLSKHSAMFHVWDGTEPDFKSANKKQSNPNFPQSRFIVQVAFYHIGIEKITRKGLKPGCFVRLNGISATSAPADGTLKSLCCNHKDIDVSIIELATSHPRVQLLQKLMVLVNGSYLKDEVETSSDDEKTVEDFTLKEIEDLTEITSEMSLVLSEDEDCLLSGLEVESSLLADSDQDVETSSIKEIKEKLYYTVVFHENAPTFFTSIKDIINDSINMNKRKLYLVNVQLSHQIKPHSMVYYYCRTSSLFIKATNSGEKIKLNTINSLICAEFRKQFQKRSLENSKIEKLDDLMKSTDTWKTIYLPKPSEGKPQSFIRSKIGVDDKTGFDIAYLDPDSFDERNNYLLYDRCVRLSSYNDLVGVEITPVLYQDGVFYYCSPASVDKVQIPLITQEADDYSASSGQPLQALSCHLFDIIYWFKFLIKDQDGSELVVNCKDQSALNFVNGITPQEILKDFSKEEEVLKKLNDISSLDEEEVPVWSQLLLSKQFNQVNSKIDYEIIGTRILS